ncbi:MAG: hypothetical protein IPJ09_21130 [Saprospiraceae bacterium]|nr:hypothetical protein [Saprospiraceae bacterium]
MTDHWKRAGYAFLYNTGSQLYVQCYPDKVTGQKMFDYLTPRLFKPLGITQADWRKS